MAVVAIKARRSDIPSPHARQLASELSLRSLLNDLKASWKELRASIAASHHVSAAREQCFAASPMHGHGFLRATAPSSSFLSDAIVRAANSTCRLLRMRAEETRRLLVLDRISTTSSSTSSGEARANNSMRSIGGSDVRITLNSSTGDFKRGEGRRITPEVTASYVKMTEEASWVPVAQAVLLPIFSLASHAFMHGLCEMQVSIGCGQSLCKNLSKMAITIAFPVCCFEARVSSRSFPRHAHSSLLVFSQSALPLNSQL